MLKKNGKVVLITGATSGIGYELVKLFARDGYTLVLIARSKDDLEKVKKLCEDEYQSVVHILAQDLSVLTSPQAVYDFVKKKELDVDVLVNNAGFGLYGPFIETNLQAERTMIMLNIMALTTLAKLFAKAMVARKQGSIINVASTAAFQPGPMMAVYFATKAYVLSFSMALSEELRRSGVRVTTLCPGTTRTHFTKKGDVNKSPLFAGRLLSPQMVAAKAYEGYKQKKQLVIPSFGDWVLVFFLRFISTSIAARIVYAIQTTEKT